MAASTTARLLGLCLAGTVAVAAAMSAPAGAGAAPATSPSSAAAASQPRGCADVVLVWAGGQEADLFRDRLEDVPGDPSVRIVDVAARAPRLERDDWSAVQRQGLEHPHFRGYRDAGARVVSTAAGVAQRCPDTPVVLGGHSAGAVAARAALRRMSGAEHRVARRQLARVLLAGDPLLDPKEGGHVETTSEARGFLVGRGPRLPRWARRGDLVWSACNHQDLLCDAALRDEVPLPGTALTAPSYVTELHRTTADLGTVRPRTAATMLTGGRDRLDGEALGMPPVRLTVVRLPRGLRIAERRDGDLIVGSPRPGRQVVVVRARGVRLAPSVERRVRVVVTGVSPAGRPGTVLVTRGRDGDPASGGSPLVSADGGTVIYSSYADNLVKRRLPERAHLFAWNAATGHTELVGLSPEEEPVEAYWRDVSADGRRVLFHSDGALWLRDRDTRTTTAAPARAQLTEDGQLVTYPEPPEGWTHTRAASPDGRFVVLERRTPRSGFAVDVAVRVVDSTTQQVVHEGTVTEPTDVRYAPAELTADGRYLKIDSGSISGRGSHVVDTADGLRSVAGANDISDDGQRLLDAGCFALDVVRHATGEATRLVAAGLGDHDYDECPLAGTSLSRDGTAVAYDFRGEQVLPRVRTRSTQIYYWRSPGT